MLQSDPLIHTYRQADALLSEGKLQQAADICKDMLAANPGFAYGYHLMASLFRSTGNLDKALVFSELAIRLDGSVPPFYMQQGQLLFALGRYDEAGAVFGALSGLEPENALYMLLRADVYARLGRFGEAQALFAAARALAGADDQAEIDEHEGLCMLAMGDAAKAEQLFDRVIAARPDHAQAHVHKSRLLLLAGRDREAEVGFAKALRCDPLSRDALHGLAVVSERQGQLDAAIALAIQAIHANSALLDSLLLLGALLLKKHNHDAAEQIYRQALTVSPEHPCALQGLAGVCMAAGRLPSLRETVAQLLAAHPRRASLQFLHDAACARSPAAPPETYVAALYDGVASRYDVYLQPQNLYRAHAFCDLLLGLPALKGRNGLSLLDLGCGSGAAAYALRGISGFCAGVDASPRMIELARLRGGYDALYAIDLVQFVMGSDRAFDLVVAFDVLCHLGDLRPFLHALRNALAPQGVAAFTVELHGERADYLLRGDARYTHRRGYVAAMLAEQGYEVLAEDEVLLRMGGPSPVRGLAVAARKMTVH